MWESIKMVFLGNQVKVDSAERVVIDHGVNLDVVMGVSLSKCNL